MASRSSLALGLAVATTVMACLGAGTYLAYRSNQPNQSKRAAITREVPVIPAARANKPAEAQKGNRTLPRESATSKGSRVQEVLGSEGAKSVTPPPASPASTATIPTTPVSEPPVTTPVPTVAAIEPPPPVTEPARPKFEEVTVKADAVIGIRLDQTVPSETAKVEDRVTGRISRDVTVDGRTVLPVGTRVEGVVAFVERGGKMRERARIGLKFTTLILADGLRVPIQTDTIPREGDSPSKEAGAKIGAGAVAGAILGAVIGGKKGAAIGVAAGAGGGTAAVAAGGRNEAVFESGALVTARLTAPLTITIEKDSIR